MRICTFITAGDPGPRCGVMSERDVTAVDVGGVIEFLARGLCAGSGRSYPLEDIQLLAPIPEPPSIRDFFAFEQHVATCRAKRNLAVAPFWYQEPVFYFTNPAAVIGPYADLAYPRGTQQLDYELELAAVIGRGEEIVGFTIMNDWSARDIQRAETSVGLGPAKAKDFATTLGPVIVTRDEFSGTSALMTAAVNGELRSAGNVADMHFSWSDIVERAARNTRLRPGDVLGSGTVGTGCILESTDERWLQIGDVVTMTVEGIGTISNRVTSADSNHTTRSA